jgi:hypothetical protein
MPQEITPEDIEAISRRACRYMNCDPDAQSAGYEAQNWQIMAAKVQECFAINRACREELASRPPAPEPPPQVYVPNNN